MDVELATAFAFGAVAIAFVAFAVVSVVLAVIDLRTHRLPNRIVGAGYVIAVSSLGVAAIAAHDGGVAMRSLGAGAVLFGALFVVRIVDPRAIGGGDVKLAGLIGLHLGWLGWDTVVLGSMFAFAGAGLFAIVLVLMHRRGFGVRIAFGPWLLGGAWAAIALTAAAMTIG